MPNLYGPGIFSRGIFQNIIHSALNRSFMMLFMLLVPHVTITYECPPRRLFCGIKSLYCEDKEMAIMRFGVINVIDEVTIIGCNPKCIIP